MTFTVSGWDIGGAHLKAALTDSQGKIIICDQVVCPLWQGIDQLTAAFNQMKHKLGSIGHIVVITMTGELVDIFKDRYEGVVAILNSVHQFFTDIPIYIFSGIHGFVELDQAYKLIASIASANYLATSQLAANFWHEGLLLDIGSTTSDFIPFKNDTPCPQGTDDHARLINGELVYSGVVRTPLMAICKKAPFHGNWVRLTAEHFATTADIYHMLGLLPQDSDLHPSADRQGKLPQDCARRLARMIGMDYENESLNFWHQLAIYFYEKQCQQLTEAIFQILSRISLVAETPIIGVGIGRFLALECARRINRPYFDFSQVLKLGVDTIDSSHGPALAIAQLGWEQLQKH
ncbi:hydantoinase/oxoprolinase family protein [Candidatus Nitrosacidococcus sp. I8]|uniref:hydantoinase/oxoprolinase family protein n=1 Tax=Candidatus Nitrosacidococcus sp. I8 TaxID=2942908 RepID=UPI002226B3E2|nr:hydantoinase/oxoprolinase family protein [Candidatus Nitrosacidococcus sp. I8]CAH9014513.1 hypothetical protein NURINAE_00071 [Candidatus Nitrosacidococcus sp. I8]